MTTEKDYTLDKLSVGGRQVLITVWSHQGAIQGQLAVYSNAKQIRVIDGSQNPLVQKAATDINILMERRLT